MKVKVTKNILDGKIEKKEEKKCIEEIYIYIKYQRYKFLILMNDSNSIVTNFSNGIQSCKLNRNLTKVSLAPGG